jgi:hypothetical protein
VRSVAALTLFLLALVVAPAAARGADWVGLGDSYAAGPLIPNQSLSPLGCLRSDHNYAHLAVPAGATLSDVSCSGAKTTNMTGSQSTSAGTNPPQFNALSAATKVVTLQISGNDIGFTEIIQNCATANPFGRNCQDRYVKNGVDELRARIAATAPKVADVIKGIRARTSATTKILVVNYAALFPSSGSGCWPQVPIAWADVPYLRGIQVALNTMLAQQAGANGATIVDAYTASSGRDACKGSGTRWVEPLVPANAAAPFHPNARGEAGVALAVRASAASA